MQTRSTIEAIITTVATEQGKNLPRLTDDLPLLDTNLDSLCLAIIVARLEDALGVDPFSTAEEIIFPSTIGEFISLYEHAIV